MNGMKRCAHCNLLIPDTQFRTFTKHEKKCLKAEPWQRLYYKRERKWPRKSQPPPKWLKKEMEAIGLEVPTAP